jgi:hypothetical protein
MLSEELLLLLYLMEVEIPLSLVFTFYMCICIFDEFLKIGRELDSLGLTLMFIYCNSFIIFVTLTIFFFQLDYALYTGVYQINFSLYIDAWNMIYGN